MTGLVWLYRVLGTAGLAAAAPVLALKARRDPRFRTGWFERLGLGVEEPRRAVWVHGASVGELRAAAPLVRALGERGLRLLVTATSPAGAQVARELAAGRGAGRLLPLDPLPWLGARVARLRPRALVLVETELWPGLLHAARGQGVPLLLVNARLSDRAFPRYRRVRPLLRPVLGWFRRIQAQSAEHARRFAELGAPADRLEVGGNLKFDLAEPDPDHPGTRALRAARQAGWAVVVAGSTHPGEVGPLARAIAALGARGLRPGLVVAPRHLERIGAAEEELRAAGFRPVRWAASEASGRSAADAFAAGEALVVDRMGWLSALYGGAAAAFVGGTLVPVGGHNPLEALVWGIPVVVGPHTGNIRDLLAELRPEGLCAEVGDPAGLEGALAAVLADAEEAVRVREAARGLFARNRGATARALEAVWEAIGDPH
ncbi:3-deoxy-D-manno-octulosonic acid transferase [Deferrisoma palaeochoriense]